MSFGRRKIPRHLIIHDAYHYRSYAERKRNYGTTWLILGVLILLSTMLLSLKVAAENVPQTHSGQLFFKNTRGDMESAVHLNSKAEVNIHGMIAKVEFTQVFTSVLSRKFVQLISRQFFSSGKARRRAVAGSTGEGATQHGGKRGRK